MSLARSLVDLIVACDIAGVGEEERHQLCNLIRESCTADGLWIVNGEQQLFTSVLLQVCKKLVDERAVTRGRAPQETRGGCL